METETKAYRSKKPPAWSIIAVVAAWLLLPLLSKWSLGSWDEAGKLGDSFGLATSLFSGLAFLGVIYTIWQQRSDADAAEDRRLREQASANQQIYQLALSTRLQSARALISEHRRAITQLNPAIGDVPVAATQLEALIQSISVDSQLNASVRKHKPELLERLQELIELQSEISRIRLKIREVNAQ